MYQSTPVFRNERVRRNNGEFFCRTTEKFRILNALVKKITNAINIYRCAVKKGRSESKTNNYKKNRGGKSSVFDDFFSPPDEN